MKQDDLISKVNFNFIRYANCWEDADILLDGLQPLKGSKILSIGSAGDNSFSLLTTHPEIVVAIDINKIQLHLIELKKAAIKILNYEDVLQFLGFTFCEKRVELFYQIKNELSVEAKKYWEQNVARISTGVIYSGKFEKYFNLFSKSILPFIHSKKTVAKLFLPKTKQEQEIFYNKVWNTWRWKLLFKIFFSKYVMSKLGRDPAFMKEVSVSVAQNMYDKAALQLQSTNAQNNWILHYSLTGNFGKYLPHYVRKENFDSIKSNIDNLVIKEGYVQQASDYYGQFDCMNLSNIFEYMNENAFASVSDELIRALNTNGTLAYWNLMVPRRISKIYPGKVLYKKQLSEELTVMDKGFFYNCFIVETKR